MELILSNLSIYNDSSISYILSFLNELVTINNLIGLFIFSGLIFLSGKAGKILDTASKLTGIAAGTTILYKELKEVVLVQVLMIIRIIIKMIKIRIIRMKRMLIKLMNLIKKIKIIIINQNYKASWFFPFLLNKLGIEESGSSNLDISYGVFLLSLIALICFINVLGFMSAHIFIKKKDYETKYPKFKKIIIKIVVYFMLF
jgi:hypothetical protein